MGVITLITGSERQATRFSNGQLFALTLCETSQQTQASHPERMLSRLFLNGVGVQLVGKAANAFLRKAYRWQLIFKNQHLKEAKRVFPREGIS